jgi:hypothetical protein
LEGSDRDYGDGDGGVQFLEWSILRPRVADHVLDDPAVALGKLAPHGSDRYSSLPSPRQSPLDFDRNFHQESVPLTPYNTFDDPDYQGEAMIEYKVEHILSFTGLGGSAPEVIGAVAEGIKVNFYNAGGEVNGPLVRGKVRAEGGDWATVRKDGIALLDVRITFETDDGALILVTYPGVAEFGEDGYDKFRGGKLPPAVRLRISPRFHTSHAKYLWMNRLHSFGVGEYDPATRTATYDVYAVR